MASLIEGLAGQDHGGWSLDRMLGQPGAFSVVYAARPVGGGQMFALKILKPERGIDPDVGFEFEREGQLLVELQQAANVVSIHEANAVLNISVMFNGAPTPLPVKIHRLEMADGCLDELVTAQRDARYWSQALQLFRDVVAGIHQMHVAGIIHRDLKSSNVLLFTGRPVGQRGQVSDLGRSCRLSDPPQFHGNAYVFGRGDPSFAPPELIFGGGSADASAYRLADLYLLGSVLCELATGQGATALLMPNWLITQQRALTVPAAGRPAMVKAEQEALRPQLSLIADLIRSVAPPTIRAELASLFMQLCDPDPAKRDLRHRRDRKLPHTDLAWLLRRVDIIHRQYVIFGRRTVQR